MYAFMFNDIITKVNSICVWLLESVINSGKQIARTAKSKNTDE
jgi:hypothetical protein